MARHVHADAIHAWAEGAEIECQDGPDRWMPTNPIWLPYANYRIVQPKVFQHKVARMQSKWPPEYLVVAQSGKDVQAIESNPDFIGWLKDADA